MTNPPLRFGLVGDGPLAAAYRQAVQQASGTAPTEDLVDLLLTDSTITAVIVAGDTAAAADAVAAALAAGRRVLVDPAMVGTPDRHDQARDWLWRGDGSLLMARPWRFHEVCRSLRAAVDADDLGPPAFLQWVDEGAAIRLAGDAERTPAVQAIIGLDLALWLLAGPPERVFARSTGGDGIAISLRFTSGANALLELRPRLVAAGAGYGAAWLLGPRGEARWAQRDGTLAIDASGLHIAPLDLRPCLAAAIAHAIACWQGEADLAVETEQTRHLLAATDAVHESLRLGQPVEVRVNDEVARR